MSFRRIPSKTLKFRRFYLRIRVSVKVGHLRGTTEISVDLANAFVKITKRQHRVVGERACHQQHKTKKDVTESQYRPFPFEWRVYWELRVKVFFYCTSNCGLSHMCWTAVSHPVSETQIKLLWIQLGTEKGTFYLRDNYKNTATTVVLFKSGTKRWLCMQ